MMEGGWAQHVAQHVAQHGRGLPGGWPGALEASLHRNIAVGDSLMRLCGKGAERVTLSSMIGWQLALVLF